MNKSALKNFAFATKNILTLHSARLFQNSMTASYESLFCFLHFIKCLYLKSNNITNYTLSPLSEATMLLWENASKDLENEAKSIKTENFYPIENIGWLYQYYNRDTKDEIFRNLQKNIRITKETLAPATQIFTPKWIAEYLTDTSFDALDKDVSVENIKLCDPCMGTGHLLLSAFDRLVQEYEKINIPPQKSTRLILESNIFGMDIDKHAVDLARFSLLMKGAEYDKSILEENISLNLIAIEEDEFEFKNAKELGSLLQVDSVDVNSPLKKQAKVMSQKYHIVITNPPYMGRKSLNENLSKYIDTHYPLGKSELYSAFILACLARLIKGGVCAMITIHTWLFIRSFTKLREYVLDNTAIISMLHTGAATFDDVSAFNALAVAFCLKKDTPKKPAEFVRLTSFYSPTEKQANINNPSLRYLVNQQDFKKIPNYAFVYHLSENIRKAFYKEKILKDFCPPKQGLATGENKRFLRLWHEVDFDKIAFNCGSIKEFHQSGKKYAPYNKGGEYRKWYGCNDWVIAFDEENFEKLSNQGNNLPSKQYYFNEGITWSLFGFENFGVRYKEQGFVFDVSGSSMFPQSEGKYILAFLASKVAFLFLSSIAPTVNFQVGDIASLPLIIDEQYEKELIALTDENIAISKEDWDSRECSWDFSVHPLAKKGLLEDTFKSWDIECRDRYKKLKANEKRINEIFIKIYGLESELSPYVADRDIALLKADKGNDVKSLISYIIGHSFGRFDNKKADFLTLDELVEKTNKFVEENLGFENENKAFIVDALGKSDNFNKVIHRYLQRNFFKEHFKAYKKRTVYWQIKLKDTEGFLYYHHYSDKTIKKLKPYITPHVYKRLKDLKLNLDYGINENYRKFFECFNE